MRGWSFANLRKQVVEAAGEIRPQPAHFLRAFCPRGSEGVVLAWVSEACLDPFGFDQTGALEPAEQRVDGSFGDHKAGAVLQPA